MTRSKPDTYTERRYADRGEMPRAMREALDAMHAKARADDVRRIAEHYQSVLRAAKL